MATMGEKVTELAKRVGQEVAKKLDKTELEQFINRGQLGDVVKPKVPADLNTYLTAGSYWINGVGQINGVPNNGTASAGVLFVYTNSAHNILQVFVEHRQSPNKNSIWTRSIIERDGEYEYSTWASVSGTVPMGPNQDLNTFHVEGIYWIDGTGCQNNPVPTDGGGTAGVLRVYTKEGSSNWIIQEFLECEHIESGVRESNCYHRFSNDSGSNWTAWCGGLAKYIRRGQLGGTKDLDRNVDLNDIVDSGNYWVLGSGLKNSPLINGVTLSGVLVVYHPSDTAVNLHQVYMPCSDTAGLKTTGAFVFHRHRIGTALENAQWGDWYAANVATEKEVLEAATDSLYVTPKGLKQFIDKGQLGAIKVLGGVDLDTCKTYGFYGIYKNNTTNAPVSASGVLLVFGDENLSGGFIYQIFYSSNRNKPACYHRVWTSEQDGWSAWYCEGQVAYLGKNVDLNTLVLDGKYWVDGAGISNSPVEYGGLVEVSTCQLSTLEAIQTFIAAAGDNTVCYHRIRQNNTWKNWSRGSV